eukprot:TRINITY_DN14752_c0_g1_i2.p1 TRINITY_DN14752_c0_g1~~TRINITY_DN14752_c0_g1_i2.p1  ORF type:complete len:170 (+),score=55.71 TRINITY_DN14752_c0_g1_i2:115-624(+)
MIRRPPRSTQSRSSAASDVYKRQGKYLGAYHTGIAANNKAHLTSALEYTFECPYGVVARKRGKRPSYVQGENCTALYLGKTSKSLFNKKIELLRESERFSKGERYGILSNNCHDFCNELIEELGLEVKVPMYAQSLDRLVGFFVPGGSLQALERFIRHWRVRARVGTSP